MALNVIKTDNKNGMYRNNIYEIYMKIIYMKLGWNKSLFLCSIAMIKRFLLNKNSLMQFCA